MVVIAKLFKTYFSLVNLSVSPKKVHYSPKEVALLHKELHCSPKKLFFSQGTFFTTWGTCLGLALSFFLFKKVTS